MKIAINYEFVAFQRKSGSDLLMLTQDEIMKLTGKIGPTLKIFAVIQQLNQQLKLKAAKAGRKMNL